jgi:VanZ family protein
MTKNPFVNAISALAYIVIVANVMFYGVEHAPQSEPTIVIPIMMLSLFTLSAAVMGYIFFSMPLQLYLDGKKKNAVDLFVKTVGAFAAITGILLTLILTKVLG